MIKLVFLAGEAMVVALFDNSGLAVALEEAGPKRGEVDPAACERLLMVVDLPGVVVGAIVMSDFRWDQNVLLEFPGIVFEGRPVLPHAVPVAHCPVDMLMT